MTKKDFSELLVSARQSRESTSHADAAYDDVLNRFAEALVDLGIDATWNTRRSGRRQLAVGPKYRPDRMSGILDVVIANSKARVSLLVPKVAQSPDELEEILADFIKDPAFQDTLDELEEQAKLPVEGFLRITPLTVSREDVLLEIPPDVQARLSAAAAAQDHFDETLAVANFAGAGKVVKGAAYRVLESAGYAVELNSEVKQVGDRYRIVGRALRMFGQ